MRAYKYSISTLIVLIVLALLTVSTGAAFQQSNTVYLPVLRRNGPLAACIPPGALIQTGTVTAVVDGDTVKATVDGRAVTIRYIGMDTPEDTTEKEKFGPEATQRNRELVLNQAVVLARDVSETDRYGRLLRYVFVGSTFINYQMVREGWAEAILYPPDTACSTYFEQAETAARSEGLGMWVGLPPPPPVGCDCSGPDLNCGDFNSHAQAQSCFDQCVAQGFGDIFNLDSDGDGLACESLP